MKRYMARVSLLLLTSMLISCGGGGGGDSPSGGGSAPSGGTPPSTPPSGGTPPGGNPPSGGGGTGTLPSAGARIEESNTAFVTFSGDWTPGNSHAGWSGSTLDSVVGWRGGAAKESTQPGATASFTFVGTSVRWLSMRSRNGGIALVRVDGGEAQEVDLFGRPADEFRTPAITIYGLSNSQHTLTIEVTGRTSSRDPSTRVVVVDAFEVEPQIVSHAQDSDPDSDLTYSAGWDPASLNFGWSGSGAKNIGEEDPGAKVTATPGATVTYKFRGTSVSWIGYSGPDAGIAVVSVDGSETTVDTYSKDFRVQQVVFTASGLTDADHTLTIRATGQKRPASTGRQIFVDAFDVTTPGRRYEQGNPTDPTKNKHFEFDQGATTIDYVGSWEYSNSRVWTEGWTASTKQQNAQVIFNFTGTSVSWIGCEKSSAGGTAEVSIDDGPAQVVDLNQSMPMEGYQREVYRSGELSPGPHKLTIKVTSRDGGPFVVVDAFDVRQ